MRTNGCGWRELGLLLAKGAFGTIKLVENHAGAAEVEWNLTVGAKVSFQTDC